MKPAQSAEEAKWMASVLDPQKAKRRLKYAYILLGVWSAICLSWIVWLFLRKEHFSWSDCGACFAFVLGTLNAVIATINTRRIATGKLPLF